MAITLHHYWRSSCSWRLRWALNLKGLEYQTKVVNLLEREQRSDAFLQLNPAGFVPVLEVDGRPMAESGAVLEWLEETHPTPPLLPQSPDDRYMVRRLAHTILAGTQPVQNLQVQKFHSKDPAEGRALARHFINRGFSAYEALLRQGKPGTFSFGGSVTHADICLIPQVYNAIRFDVTMDAYPLISGIYERALGTEACAAAAPEKFAPK